MKNFIKENKYLFVFVALVGYMFGLIYTMYMVSSIQESIDKRNQKADKHIEELQKKSDDMDDMLKKVNAAIDNVTTDMSKLKKEQQRLTVKGDFDKADLPNVEFTQNTDLKKKPTLTVNDMNKLISIWDKRVPGGTRLTGQGAAFIEAAKKTGYNPVYLFAHAAVESAWGSSHYAVSRGNYYGINAVDTNPDNASIMGSTKTEGIVKGGEWIDSNFYKNGYITLNEMCNGNYASDPSWGSSITQIVNSSYKILATV